MEQKTGGLSKGCLIGIIIASSLLFLAIVTGITCYVYREDLAKWAASYSMNGLKGEAAKHPEILDTARFDSFVDSFAVRLKERPFDAVAYSSFMGAMQPVPKWIEDHKLDSAELNSVFDAMVTYFPDLAPMRPFGMSEVKSDTAVPPATAAPGESLVPSDSTATK
jgi:hypothetical protein